MIKLLGFVHKAGTSKNSGNAYNFYELHFVTDIVNTDHVGQFVYTETCSPEALQIDEKLLNTKIGMEVDLQYTRIADRTRLAAVRFK